MITPDEARDLLDGTTPGPWTMHRPCPEDFIRVTGEDLKDIADNGIVEDADARLIAAAPELAQAIAGMQVEYTVEYSQDAGETWHSMRRNIQTRESAEETLLIASYPTTSNQRLRYRIVQRLISTPEVIDGD